MKKISVAASRVHGKGIFAAEDIAKGEKIQYIQGRRVRTSNRKKPDKNVMATWFGVGRNLWIDPGSTPFRYLNHSCYPNAAITGTKTLVALEKIAVGQEITIDYSMTDPDPTWSLKCQCGEKTCRKHIQAIYTVPEAVFKRHMPYVPRYFQRAYVRNHVKKHV